MASCCEMDEGDRRPARTDRRFLKIVPPAAGATPRLASSIQPGFLASSHGLAQHRAVHAARSTAMAANAWDGDPWEVGSDDEEFVSRASGSGVGRASTSRSTLSAINTAPKASPGATPSAASERSPNSATATSRLGALWGSGAAAPAGATTAPRAHAPPARPHPISFGSYKEKRTASQTRHGSETLDQLKRTDSGTSISTKASDGANRRTSWLIVDPDTLTSVPPLDRGASNGRSVSPNERASPAQGSSSTSGKGKAALRGSPSPISPVREPPDLQGAIEGDIDKLLEDPSAALERLSIQWASGEGDKGPLSPISTGLPSIAAGFSNAPPPEALQGDAFPPATPVRENAGPHLLKARVASPAPTVSRSGTPSLESQDRLTVSDANASLGRKQSQRSTRRRTQFLACLSVESVDLTQLRTLAWKGVPSELRPLVWQLLLGYLPTAQAARKAALARKRAEYSAGVQMAFAKGTSGLDQAIWHQISIDVPRTNPGRPLWQREATQRVRKERFLSRTRGQSLLMFRVSPHTHSRLSGYCTSGRYDIPPVAMCKASTTWPHPSSRSSSAPTSTSSESRRSHSTRVCCQRRCGPPWKQTLSGACPRCSTAYRTTTSLHSQESSVKSVGSASSSRASTRRSMRI